MVIGGQRLAAVSARQIVAAAAADADTACLADALADPGPADAHSPEGYRRITAIGAELARLRGCLAHPVNDLVNRVRRVLGVDAEVRAASRRRAWLGCRAPRPVRRRGGRYAERPGTDAPDR